MIVLTSIAALIVYDWFDDPTAKRIKKELKQWPLEGLERAVFYFDEQYFLIIGIDEKAVLEFREIVEQRDIERLARCWNRLCRAFLRLERKAGHRGRPMLHFEWYCYHDLFIRELRRRFQ